MTTILPIGTTVCIACRTPVAIVRRTVELPCGGFHMPCGDEADSEHRRHGHREAVTGCEWCVRITAIDLAFRGVPQDAVADPDVAWAGSLWDAA